MFRRSPRRIGSVVATAVTHGDLPRSSARCWPLFSCWHSAWLGPHRRPDYPVCLRHSCRPTAPQQSRPSSASRPVRSNFKNLAFVRRKRRHRGREPRDRATGRRQRKIRVRPEKPRAHPHCSAKSPRGGPEPPMATQRQARVTDAASSASMAYASAPAAAAKTAARCAASTASPIRARRLLPEHVQRARSASARPAFRFAPHPAVHPQAGRPADRAAARRRV